MSGNAGTTAPGFGLAPRVHPSEELAAFDTLPKAVRDFINRADFLASPSAVRMVMLMRGLGEDYILEVLRYQEAKMRRAFRDKHGLPD